MKKALNGKKVPSRYTTAEDLSDFAIPEVRYSPDAQSLVVLGRKAFGEGNMEGALRLFRMALSLEPDNRLATYFEKKTALKMKMRGIAEQRRAAVKVHIKVPKDIPRAPSTVKCQECSGDGMCTKCKGSGMCASCDGTTWLDLLGKTCGMCDESGVCDLCAGRKRCVRCNGSGYVVDMEENKRPGTVEAPPQI